MSDNNKTWGLLCEANDKIRNAYDILQEAARILINAAPHEMTAREFRQAFLRLRKDRDANLDNRLAYLNLEDAVKVCDVDEAVTIVEQWAKEHPEKKRKTYLEDFMQKFPKVKVFVDGKIAWFCRMEIYDGITGCCKGRGRGECITCWNEEMEDEE